MRRSTRDICLVLALSAAVAGCSPPAPKAYVSEGARTGLRVAILPLTNYTPARDAPARIEPVLAVELSRQWRAKLANPGKVEAALAKEPWVLLDRLPPDLVDRIAEEVEVDALLVGSVLGFGFRDAGSAKVPYVSLSLRLLAAPGGEVLWSAVHSRDGTDGESIFGIGRVSIIESLMISVVQEMVATYRSRSAGGGAPAELAARTAPRRG